MRSRTFTLSLRFSLATGTILLLFCALFSTILYYYLKMQVIRDAEEKTEIIMTHVRALGDYVKGSLRPRMFDLLSKTKDKDEFIIEGMSTTHINLQVMKRFSEDLPDYLYRRVSDRPLNPENSSDAFHDRMLRSFREGREKGSWHGREKMGGKEFLVSARPVTAEKSCLQCHGEQGQVSPAILKLYGNKGKFGWKAGEVAGIESVSISLHAALVHARKIAFDAFIFGLGTLWFLFLAFYATFRQLVTTPLNHLSGIFRGIANGTEPLGRAIPIARKDEIGDLTESFNLLACHLLAAQEKLKETAEIEKQLIETEKLAALGQLSAGVAHEINNPLGGIRLCFNNLMDTGMDAQKRQQHIDVINMGFDRIQNIVRHLLHFSKNTPLSLAPASLTTVVENVLHLAGYTLGKRGISLVKELSPSMPVMQVDANKLEQVFLNLIMNAAQAMEGGGVLTIRTWCEGAWGSVSVSDTGKGIPPEVLPKIFSPFFTTKGVGEGTGLGLTVSRAIVEQHKGAIRVETSEKGTTFTVQVPMVPVAR
ncbi:MAG: DUF3365 domain-containing protein [Thermodesulfovibrionales bacterium]